MIAIRSDVSSAIWISDNGRPLTPKMIGHLISRRTQIELGAPLNPHLFRKVLATETAIRDPEHVGIVQPILGHAAYRTSEGAYNLARSIDAARRLQATLQAAKGENTGLIPQPPTGKSRQKV